MIKLFICTPAYEGKVNVQYAISLTETYAHLLSKGIECVIRINTSGSLLCAERNRLTEMFYQSDCTHMLCIDGDLGWPPECVFKFLEKDLDFIAGCYPSRKENTFLFRPRFNPDSSLVINKEKEVIEMESVPAGFMLIKRCVIEKLRDDNPDLVFCPKNTSHMTDHGKIVSKGYCLFETKLINGEFWGEDYVFCLRAKESGFKIWCDPLIVFDHDGRVGALVEALTQDKEKALKI